MVTACIPLILLIPMVAGLLWSAGQAAYDKILTSKVRSDLVLAQKEFANIQEFKHAALRTWAESAYLRAVLQRNKGTLNATELQAFVDSQGLSYLRLVSPTGKVLASTPSHDALVLDKNELRQLRQLGSSTEMVLMSEEELTELSPELALRAAQPIVPTLNASPTSESIETRALMVQMRHPLYSEGTLLGYLEGGLMLNGNLAIVDGINDLIYSPNTLLEGSYGTATLFLEDVRVATTVRDKDRARALGTRVSDVVRETVLGRGEVWLERAFVVNDWFYAAYAPLTSADGSRIGMIYVGFLEEPYAGIKTQLLMLFLIAVALAMVLGSFLVTRLVSGIFYPLRRMNYVMSRQEMGDNTARVGDLRRSDEFADLAEHFDVLLNQLDQRRTELESLNAQLDARVNERTADLHAANQKLHQALEQLLASEKLAVMGQLTAGFAHEFNNPLAVMMGHLDLLRISNSPDDTLQVIRFLDEQIQRMRHIVQKLLQFSRPDEFASYTESLNPTEVIQDSLLFAKSEISNAGASVHLNCTSNRTVQMSKTELQQVMVNLLINAAHALELVSGVRNIWISTRDVLAADGSEAVLISVENNGEPIPPQQLQLIFQMFYTTKRAGRGTGLGLPVSRMLVQRYGGDLQVASPSWPHVQPTGGARFEILLRCKSRPSADILKESEQQRFLFTNQPVSEGNGRA